jgi:hypothetical protein
MRKLRTDFGQGFKWAKPGNEEHKNHIRTIDKHIKLHQQDWKNVVVVNMHPFPVQQGFGDAGNVYVKGAEEGKPYREHLIDMYRITKADHGNADYEPIEILPVEQAMELERKYWIFGGVFWYFQGEEFPADKFREAGLKQLKYYRTLVRRARDEWAKHHSMVRIGDNARMAAKFLAKHENLDISDFQWLDMRKTSPHCEQCGEDIKKDAKICKHCQWPLDKAWVAYMRPDLAKTYGLKKEDFEDPALRPKDETKTIEDLVVEGMVDDEATFGGADLTPMSVVKGG